MGARGVVRVGTHLANTEGRAACSASRVKKFAGRRGPSRRRPTLKSLRLHGRSFAHLDFRYDNSCLFAIFSRFMLQTLEIEYLTTDIVTMCAYN